MEPVTHTVNPGGEGTFNSVTDALNAAIAGDTVTVKPGLYEELLKVSKEVTLTAVPDDSLAESEAVITNGVVIAANVTMRGLRIRGKLDVRKGHALIEDCDIHDGPDGVRVGEGAKLTIRRSRVHHCESGGDGIYFSPGSSGEVVDCDIYECRVNGIHAHNAVVTAGNNRIRDVLFGMYFRGQSTGAMEKNSVEHVRKFGIYVTEGSDPVVQGNQVRECGMHCAFVSQGGKGIWTENNFEGSMHVHSGCDAKLGSNQISGKLDVDVEPVVA
ncbi:parallel beta-helix repeat-containing protein [Trypanosoma conorhini]|uniref:Parallel beta-helix repeat-containing protein n=1 Tax=Trypanosoma conorhini TaxID=83891 RepID=A0A3R7MY51_9TRYP|nr:parallel beta-helix repeat-containing protein [Trypanosoma conorhini]RNF22451.1 parallel beta-helix repeat-containing protein [Trypanosoma conorhini]